ncbi:hypothetical protein J2W49_002946 [Hydrogenophaga palleronii]|uniref:Uncharacterized protein n=1 Tax=Hydrogenophaga palleronii TaxID=65655 RepID=A0ABU1WNW9_9BURK|nr:hypothetical protein [Hydrogenophaga palleronii]MDR7150973.1 hypothetical protein [Hydrogenophaga palleronii]
MTTPRVTFGATPLEGGQYLRPGEAGSAVFLDRGARAPAQAVRLGDASSVASLNVCVASSAVFLGYWRSARPALLH